MDNTLVVAVIAGIFLPTIGFIYGQYTKMKKDYTKQLDRLEEQVTKLSSEAAKNSESFARVHLRIDKLDHEQEKLETVVEAKLDRFADKLEKIYDLLISRD